MSAPMFGRLADADVPTFGAPPARRGRPDHACIAAAGLPCPHPGPHARPAGPDPATVPAFPELEPTPTLWGHTQEHER